MNVASSYTQIADLGQGDLVNKIAQGTVNAGVKTAILGGKFTDNLIDEAASVAFESIGHDLYNNSEYKGFLPPKSITQGLVGGVLAELKGGDFTSGAIATATSHFVAEQMLVYYEDDILNGNIKLDELEKRIKVTSSLVSGGRVALLPVGSPIMAVKSPIRNSTSCPSS